MVDTNVIPIISIYLIPGNDDAIRDIKLLRRGLPMPFWRQEAFEKGFKRIAKKRTPLRK
jgi:ribosomal protein S2